MGILTPLLLEEMKEEAIPPRLEDPSKEEAPQPKQPEISDQPSTPPTESEQGPPLLMVQLGLLRAETDR